MTWRSLECIATRHVWWRAAQSYPCRVLALKPKLVVADEPTSGLDPERRELVLEALIKNLPKKPHVSWLHTTV